MGAKIVPDQTTADAGGDAALKSDPIRDKAVRLFRYLSALAELRAKTVRDVASYEAVFWFSDLPRENEKECYTPAWDGGETTDEENWLRIDKPSKPALPRPPVECENWFDTATLDNVLAEPDLHDEIVDPMWVPGDRQDGDESDLPPPPTLPKLLPPTLLESLPPLPIMIPPPVEPTALFPPCPL